MKPADNRAWKPGDMVCLTRQVEGRYSSYEGREHFTAPSGTIAIIRSGPWPAVAGRERDFYMADVPGWREGIVLWNGDARKV
jgi:hypothetical protein